MKEVTYEEWQKNPTVRMMWVWDDKVGDKVKRKVIYFNENKYAHYPIIALSENSATSVGYKHCAEIEEPKRRRMTNKELAQEIMEMRNRIAELEKENAELKSEFGMLKTSEY